MKMLICRKIIDNLPNLKKIVPIVPNKNKRRGSILTQIDINAKVIRDPKSIAAPNDTIIAVSICEIQIKIYSSQQCKKNNPKKFYL